MKAVSTSCLTAAAGAQAWLTDTMGDIVVSDDGIAHLINGLGLIKDIFVYLPMNSNSAPPTATATATATNSGPTATTPAPPTLTPTATNTQPPSSTGNLVITNIFFDGAGSSEPDEYVQFQNAGANAVQLNGWTLRDEANHTYTFPSFVMQPGQTCRVYTNQSHPEWCGFNYGSGTAIWNNSGDCAYLRDSSSALVDEFCY